MHSGRRALLAELQQSCSAPCSLGEVGGSIHSSSAAWNSLGVPKAVQPTRLAFAPQRASEGPLQHVVHQHFYLGPPVGSVHGSPHSLLPFLAGSAFGALGLAVWQQNVQADSRGLPPPSTHSHPQHVHHAQSPSPYPPHSNGLPGPYGTMGSSSSFYQEPYASCSTPSTSSSPTDPHNPALPSPWHHTSGVAQQASSLLQLVSWPWGRLWDSGGGAQHRPHTGGGPPTSRGPSHQRTSAADIQPGAIQGVTLDQAPADQAHAHSSRSGPAPAVCSPADRPPVVTAPAGRSASLQPAGGEDSSAPLTRGSISCASAAAAPAVVHIVVGPEGGVAAVGAGAAHAARYRSSSGSGFVYHPSGYILTNAHVVAGAPGPQDAQQAGLSPALHHSSSGSGSGVGSDAAAAAVLSITMQDGRVVRGRVVAVDRVSDIAVVKAELGAGEQLPSVAVGRSARLQAGEWVVALGTPLMLKHSVTAGIVSCVERRGSELGLEGARTAYIQTDAAINQGSSGGPLINLDGEVVGMSVFKAVAADGVSFAIPMDTVCAVVRQFHDHGRVIRPYVGVTLVEVSNGALKQLQQQVPQLANAKAAVVIQAVKDGSPAQEAGLVAEDIVLTLDGRHGLGMSEVVDFFGKSVGLPVTVGVIRQAPGGGPPALLIKQLTPKEAAAQ